MFTITATLDGAVIIDRKLEALEERIADMRPAWPAVESVFREIVRAAFESEGASGDSGPWAPLKPGTIADRERAGFPGAHPILQRTGELYRSLVGTTSDTISVQEANYFAIGTAVPWVVFHQSTEPRSKIPRRPLVALTPSQKNQIFLPIRRHVTGHDPNAPTRRRIE